MFQGLETELERLTEEYSRGVIDQTSYETSVKALLARQGLLSIIRDSDAKEGKRQRRNSVDHSKKEPEQAVEVLLHNVSHSDLVLSINDHNDHKQNLPSHPIIARPKFNFFRQTTEKLLNVISRDMSSDRQISTIAVPKSTRYQVASTLRYSVRPTPDGSTSPAGFDLSKVPVQIDDASTLRFRRGDDRSQPNEQVQQASCNMIRLSIVHSYVSNSHPFDSSGKLLILIFLQ